MWEFFARSLDASTIFTFAALGELINQRSGILNVGIEGVMLFGATLGFIVAQTTENYLLGFLVGILIGGLLGLLHGFFSIMPNLAWFSRTRTCPPPISRP